MISRAFQWEIQFGYRDFHCQAAGRIKARGGGRDAYTYSAAPLGVDAQALAAVWLAELNAPIAGAKSSPIDKTYREEKNPRNLPLLSFYRSNDQMQLKCHMTLQYT